MGFGVSTGAAPAIVPARARPSACEPWLQLAGIGASKLVADGA